MRYDSTFGSNRIGRWETADETLTPNVGHPDHMCLTALWDVSAQITYMESGLGCDISIDASWSFVSAWTCT